jgi:hypothetical protein
MDKGYHFCPSQVATRVSRLAQQKVLGLGLQFGPPDLGGSGDETVYEIRKGGINK